MNRVTTRCWGQFPLNPHAQKRKNKTSSLYFQPCRTAVNASFISQYRSHITASVAGSSLSDNPSPTPFHQGLWNLRGQPATCLSQIQTGRQEHEVMLVQTTVNCIRPTFPLCSHSLPVLMYTDVHFFILMQTIETLWFPLIQLRRITHARSLEYH